MKLYTGYWASAKKYREAGMKIVSICTRVPKWEEKALMYRKIMELKELAPYPSMLHLPKDQYLPLFYNILSKANPDEIITKIEGFAQGNDVVLMCYENYADCQSGKSWSHRHIVAKWLKEKTGIEVNEYQAIEKPDPQQSLF